MVDLFRARTVQRAGTLDERAAGAAFRVSKRKMSALREDREAKLTKTPFVMDRNRNSRLGWPVGAFDGGSRLWLLWGSEER